jgi:hypothetical protein
LAQIRLPHLFVPAIDRDAVITLADALDDELGALSS